MQWFQLLSNVTNYTRSIPTLNLPNGSCSTSTNKFKINSKVWCAVRTLARYKFSLLIVYSFSTPYHII